ncbi:general substrate transporter [Talaromyces proteolyticus]|uniref:General substrate transporter n=1 Tax=Talaromyces proteolyticus TaxID=1131652 RepID=A0AAD4KTX4_9EURO|nr:general substrate transporter [Talaromyces proteolyticus]KAH8696014.1 general substrate transporter [Talaromyces proteolyticus]
MEEKRQSGDSLGTGVAEIHENERGGAPNPLGRGHLQLYALCALVYLCSTMNGYDGSLMGSINSLPEYLNYYHQEQASASTGLVFSIFQIAQMIASLFVWICDWRGRKPCIVFSCVGVCAGAVFTALAPTLPAFIGARFMLSFFSTIACVAAPLLLVEIAPPLYRGTVAGTYNTLYYMGYVSAPISTIYGCNLHVTGNLKWRLPLWLQMLCPGIVVLGGWFLPESPRWLVAKGRIDEAKAFIVKYHANGDVGHPIVDIEMREIQDSLEEGGIRSARDYFDLRTLVKKRSSRYRLMLVVAMAWFGQFSGNNIASYYLPLLVKNVGITNTNTVLLLNAIYAVTGWISATAGAHFHDVWGRRKMLLGSCIGMAISLAIVASTAAEYVHSGSVPSSSASIAFIYIFGVVFAFSYTPMQPIYPAEVLSNNVRANGMMIFQITAGCSSFVNTFAAPVALQNIGYWFYVFFVLWDLFEAAFIYLFFVETKGRTLEELDEVFEAKNPRKASTRKLAA